MLLLSPNRFLRFPSHDQSSQVSTQIKRSDIISVHLMLQLIFMIFFSFFSPNNAALIGKTKVGIGIFYLKSICKNYKLVTEIKENRYKQQLDGFKNYRKFRLFWYQSGSLGLLTLLKKKNMGQQSSTRKAGFLNLSISLNRTCT